MHGSLSPKASEILWFHPDKLPGQVQMELAPQVSLWEIFYTQREESHTAQKAFRGGIVEWAPWTRFCYFSLTKGEKQNSEG